MLDLDSELSFLVERIKGLRCFLLGQNWAQTHFSPKKLNLLNRRLSVLQSCREVVEEEMILDMFEEKHT